MDRRQFLAGTIVGVAGLAAGGTALGATRLGRAAQERDNSVLPDGPSHVLGCRQLIWSVPTSQPLAALTFDDGPDPEFTPRIFGVLARYGLRATFNVMGYNAVRHRDLIQALMDNGHELGNHTWSHEDLAFQSPAATARQLDRALVAIEQIAGVRPRFFRPPWGELTGAAVQAAARLGHDILLWSVTRGPAGARVLRARREVELAALPAAIERLLARNLRLVTASALVDAPRHPENPQLPAKTASEPGRHWLRISSR